MTIFDILFFHFFNYYKKSKKSTANKIATVYLTALQASLLLLLGVFFAGFFKQMHVNTMTAPKAWSLFVIATLFIAFKNWMQYGGQKRKVLNAKIIKTKKLDYNIGLLWSLPFVALGMAYIISLAA